MDATLHCNNLKCRALCPDRAITTTCCHIFCLQCGDKLGLSDPRDGQRRCPACKTVLLNPDDAIIAQLNPSEDYRASLLAGLNPTIIMEITGRGLTFWNYQMAQEITYQDYLAKSLTERYHTLGSHLDRSLKEASDEVNDLKLKLQEAHEALNEVHRKHEKLLDAYKDKAKSQQQVHKLYQNLKQQQLAAGIELAAGHDADNVLHDLTGGQHHGGSGYSQNRGAGSNDSGNSGERRARMPSTNPWQSNVGISASRGSLQSSHTLPMHNEQRTRLPQPAFGTFNHTITGARSGAALGSNESLRQGSSLRGSFAAVDPTGFTAGGSSYGLGGVRASKHPQETFGSQARGGRPPPGLSGLRMR